MSASVDRLMTTQMRQLAEEFYFDKVLSPIADEVGDDVNALHEQLLSHCFGRRRIFINGGFAEVPARTTREMTDDQFKFFVRRAQQIGQWLDLPMISLPQYARELAGGGA